MAAISMANGIATAWHLPNAQAGPACEVQEQQGVAYAGVACDFACTGYSMERL